MLAKTSPESKYKKLAADPKTGKIPENWHQRLSELRTDSGYTIQSPRDTKELRVSQYRMVSTEKRTTAGKRVKIHPETWEKVLRRAKQACEWCDGGESCGLKRAKLTRLAAGLLS